MNELEMFLVICGKALDEMCAAATVPGRVFNKGAKHETRMRYRRARELIDVFHDYFALRGAFSFGICGTCGSWKKGACTKDGLGHCTRKMDITSRFDACERHSKEAGRYGL